jgi:hypothetical protein
VGVLCLLWRGGGEGVTGWLVPAAPVTAAVTAAVTPALEVLLAGVVAALDC